MVQIHVYGIELRSICERIDDENGNKVIKDYDKNDFLGASVIHGLKVGRDS